MGRVVFGAATKITPAARVTASFSAAPARWASRAAPSAWVWNIPYVSGSIFAAQEPASPDTAATVSPASAKKVSDPRPLPGSASTVPHKEMLPTTVKPRRNVRDAQRDIGRPRRPIYVMPLHPATRALFRVRRPGWRRRWGCSPGLRGRPIDNCPALSGSFDGGGAVSAASGHARIGGAAASSTPSRARRSHTSSTFCVSRYARRPTTRPHEKRRTWVPSFT